MESYIHIGFEENNIFKIFLLIIGKTISKLYKKLYTDINSRFKRILNDIYLLT